MSGSRTRVGLFLFFQALYALTSSGNAFRIPDEFEVYFQTEHLIDAGDISVPQTLEIRQPVIVNGQVVNTTSVFFGKVGLDGKPYAPYGPLAAVLAAPHHLIGRAVAGALGVTRVPRQQGLAWVILVGGITMLTTATAGALAVVGFHRAAIAIGTPQRSALWLSLLLGGATVLWPYGTTFYTEAWQAAMLVWAAVLLIEARAGVRPVPGVAIACVLIALTGLTKVTSLIFAPAFVVAVLGDRAVEAHRRWRVAIAISLAIAIAALIHLVWNSYRFGSPFEFGYDWTETIPGGNPRAFLITDIPRGLAVLLFSPGKSLFLWAPMLLLSLLQARTLLQRDRGLAAGLGAALLVGLVVFAAYLFPEGGYAHGPRNLVPIIPLLALGAAGPDAGRWSPRVLIACGVVGFAIALLATHVSFLEDQSLHADANGRIVPGYYEQVDPPPGRPNNRYRLGYIPFLTAMSMPGWSESPALGQGPDHFYRHLVQAQHQLPDGGSIPSSLPTAWAATWIAVMFAGVGVLVTPGARPSP
jgi:hypothetical protein